MLKNLFLIVSILFGVSTLAQKIEIYGIAVDEDGRPVPGARYYFSNSKDKFLTNDQGEFSINYEIGNHDTLIFESYGLDKYLVYISERLERRAKKTGKIRLDVTIPEKVFDPIIVFPTMPDTIVSSLEYSVEDFAFDKEGSLVLLTYDKNVKKGCVLRLLDNKNEVIDVHYLDVNDRAIELKSDFRGNIHLLTEANVYLVFVEDRRLRVLQENRDDYFRLIEPIIDTIGQNIYFSNYSELYPAVDYFEFNVLDSTYKILLTVEDKETMEFYRAEFKYLNNREKLNLHRRQLETGIDKEIWAGAMYYTRSIYYIPIYAPLFKVDDDSIIIFDHYKNLMFKYSSTGGFVDSLRISYHKESKKSGWESPIIQDKVSGNVYALFLRNGYTYLSEIDKNSGQVKQSFKLYYKYVERIQIINGEVFYIYRPFESIQKKYIYREKLEEKV